MLKPRTQTIAFRIWQHCDPLGWDLTMTECADAIELSLATVRHVSVLKGWCGRFRVTTRPARFTAGVSIIPTAGDVAASLSKTHSLDFGVSLDG